MTCLGVRDGTLMVSPGKRPHSHEKNIETKVTNIADRLPELHRMGWNAFPIASESSKAKPIKPDSRPANWSPEAHALSQSLERTDSLRVETGIEIVSTYESFDPAWKRRTNYSSDLMLYSNDAG